jgi:hypothetical protein
MPGAANFGRRQPPSFGQNDVCNIGSVRLEDNVPVQREQALIDRFSNAVITSGNRAASDLEKMAKGF